MINKSKGQYADYILKSIKTKKSTYWRKKQIKKSLQLFHLASDRVPAYKDFLKKNNINPKKIKTWNDFTRVPMVNKKNYIRKYLLKDLCWDGDLYKPMILTATSGSTGEPSYFLRQKNLDWQYSVSIQRFLQNSSYGKNMSTLVIICFGMGVWIAGIITYKAFELAGFRGNFPLSIITPGINKKEIFNSLKRLSPQYDQTLLVGYAPFIKDVIDEAKTEGINLKKLNIRLGFAAESITEGLRDYMKKHAGVKNIFTDFFNIYGSADIGAMAFEDTTSILIRRLAINNKDLFKDIFTVTNKTPTLAQYNPEFINFESLNGEILLTGDNAIPLIRYSIGDNGNVLTYDEVETILTKNKINLMKIANKFKIADKLTELPFVYVYERQDFSVSLYGLNIYPEWIKNAIVSTNLGKKLTGKFTMVSRFDKHGDQYLEINTELKKGAKATIDFKRSAEGIMTNYLARASSEYAELLHHLKERAVPKLKYHVSEDPEYFKSGIKHKWVK
ncbi:hypothetical protein COV58_02990 [Candidatus Roizmanbacteria bacterium CG11_big_fil_rev_8_21_14_0_20_36_8]|uniref:Phenylacetate--CoA ligase n=2 Tax=Candidatus Roizmaniibacteriota TaxID=1752723 RepID=A0A2M6ITW2_9BACT|nr:MAG: hypothetical protein COV58_02990 [Candidatus Roizmanbacteria bacterium CG11_big_fil_rev_8_21_14_0_20_36_8]PIZ65804.1 MAG: hypothetical protein COY14_01695 [Candidatus Roizmanbacteria bacterium CG_4_10_14_0_2_um_filter_36_9]